MRIRFAFVVSGLGALGLCACGADSKTSFDEVDTTSTAAGTNAVSTGDSTGSGASNSAASNSATSNSAASNSGGSSSEDSTAATSSSGGSGGNGGTGAGGSPDSGGAAGSDDGSTSTPATTNTTTNTTATNTTGTVEPTCSDDQLNGIESDIDCGGDCAPCEDGQACNEAEDCTSQVCGVPIDGGAGAAGAPGVAGAASGPSECLPAACDDLVHNGDETDVDCGAECAACGPGSPCTLGTDCDSSICGDDGLCVAASCGDQVVNGSESCDSGGVDSLDCDADCSAVACPDAHFNEAAGEPCDDGGDSATCDGDCSAVACGDGYPNAVAGEVCDDAGDSVTCDADCSAATCGDGHVNGSAGETCDDAGESGSCDADCTAPVCGDGVVNTSAGEACDNAGDSPTCNADCSVPECGDGYVNTAAGEQCEAGVGCNSPTCSYEPVVIEITTTGLVEMSPYAGCGGSEWYNSPMQPFGFTWTDPGVVYAPSSITVEFGGSWNCGSVGSTSLNGTGSGTFVYSSQGCVCNPSVLLNSWQLTDVSGYAAGSNNTFLVEIEEPHQAVDHFSGWASGTYARILLAP